MVSTYNDWKAAYLAEVAGSPAGMVRVHILESEYRIAAAILDFKAMLAASFDALMAAGVPVPASEALAQVVVRAPADPALGYLLPMDGPSHPTATTHVTSGYLARFGTFGDVNSDASAPVLLPVRSAEVFKPWKRSIWLSPDDCSAVPTEVAKNLGLPHFQGAIVYRIDFEVGSVAQFTPTCIDAGLFEAWQEVPQGRHVRCGLTRHLETGERVHNEFVVRTTDVPDRDIELVRLPTSGGVARVGSLTPDYWVDR